MVNSQWYIVAFSALMALLTVHFSFPVFLLLFLTWLFLLYRKKRAGKAAVVLSLLMLSYFTVFTIPSAVPSTSIQLDKEITVTGKVQSSISSSSSKFEFLLALPPPENANLLVTFFFHKETALPPDWKRGAVCRVSGVPELPSTSTNPGQFDYREYLLQQNITHQIIIGDVHDVECTGGSVINYLDLIRQRIMQTISEGLQPETAGWIKALLFGNRDDIPEEVSERFQEWGLSHLLAISGLHVGLLTGIAYFFLVKGNFITKEKAGSLLIATLPVYVIIAGESPSVWRACLMGAGALILTKGNLKLTVMDILSIIFLVTLIVAPFMVYQLSFQFSFLVTFALLLSRRLFKENHHFLFTPLMITLISQLAILPLQVDQFYYLNPLSPFANLLFVPYFSLFVVPALLLVVFLLYTAPLLLPVTETIFLIIHEKALFILTSMSEFDFSWVIGNIPGNVYVAYFILFSLFMANWTAGARGAALKYSCVIVMLFWAVSLKPFFSEQGIVTALDMGQGDSVVIELPNRKGVILIDTGGTISNDFLSVSDKSYKQVLKPYLHSRGITHLDAVFLTHPDLDHAGNFSFVKKEFTIGNVLVSRWFDRDASDSAFIEKKDLESFTKVDPGYHYTVNGHRFDVLSPQEDFGSSNENSLVLFTEIGGLRWLFTGDIEEKAENRLLELNPGIDVDVLKIAHHGSSTSSDEAFLQQLTPEQALISVGRDNRYGHPAEETIKKLNDLSTEIYRTDQDGAIQFKFMQTERKFTGFLPR